ncbi:MAG: zinc-ribbon domain-containing protein [Candidatus Bathyarchaeota archaeon]|nr:zinc-ribbon domain-containing protein [Candidatus Bathyarchaeota archaeon]
MVYCSNCGAPVADEANFCPKCGTKTPKGTTSNVKYPSGELEDAFYRVGTELERAFTIAARETEAALKRARASIKDKPAETQATPAAVVCPSCGAQNVEGAVFCNSCGKRITPEA